MIPQNTFDDHATGYANPRLHSIVSARPGAKTEIPPDSRSVLAGHLQPILLAKEETQPFHGWLLRIEEIRRLRRRTRIVQSPRRRAIHEVILTSEVYASKESAKNGIASVQTNSPSDDRYERKTATDAAIVEELDHGHVALRTMAALFLVLHGNQWPDDWQELEMYSSASARDKAWIESVPKANGASATRQARNLI